MPISNFRDHITAIKLLYTFPKKQYLGFILETETEGANKIYINYVFVFILFVYFVCLFCLFVCLFVFLLLCFFSLFVCCLFSCSTVLMLFFIPAAQVGGGQGEFPQPTGRSLQEKESWAGGRGELQEEESHWRGGRVECQEEESHWGWGGCQEVESKQGLFSFPVIIHIFISLMF